MYKQLFLLATSLVSLVNSQFTCTQVCTQSIKCTLKGDPHLNSFFGVKKFISVDDDEIINIYTSGDFIIDATTYHRDIMDRISFGNYVWHKRDCKKNIKFLDTQVHTFPNGDTIEGTVKCSRFKGKKHLDLVLIKSVNMNENQLINEVEANNTGVCTIGKNKK